MERTKDEMRRAKSALISALRIAESEAGVPKSVIAKLNKICGELEALQAKIANK